MIKTLKTHFLPLGLLGAILWGLTFPNGGMAFGQLRWMNYSTIQCLVALVFLIFGLVFEVGLLPPLGKIAKALSAAIVVNLLGGPALAAALTSIFQHHSWFSPGLSLGLTLMLTVPTTVSSGIVLARQSGGSVELSVVLTLALTLLGVGTMAVFLSGAGTQEILHRLFALGGNVVLPLLIGMLLRWSLKKIPPKDLALLPSVAIILVVWLTVSRHQASISALPPLRLGFFALLGLCCHALLFAAAWSCGKLFALDRASTISLAMVASQKTLPLALLSLAAFPPLAFSGIAAAEAIAFCVVFHFCQISFDSLIAVRLMPSKAASL